MLPLGLLSALMSPRLNERDPGAVPWRPLPPPNSAGFEIQGCIRSAERPAGAHLLWRLFPFAAQKGHLHFRSSLFFCIIFVQPLNVFPKTSFKSTVSFRFSFFIFCSAAFQRYQPLPAASLIPIQLLAAWIHMVHRCSTF